VLLIPSLVEALVELEPVALSPVEPVFVAVVVASVVSPEETTQAAGARVRVRARTERAAGTPRTLGSRVTTPPV
jgi:hypothetical protein